MIIFVTELNGITTATHSIIKNATSLLLLLVIVVLVNVPKAITVQRVSGRANVFQNERIALIAQKPSG